MEREGETEHKLAGGTLVVKTGLLKVKVMGSRKMGVQDLCIVQIISLIAHTKLETFHMQAKILVRHAREHQLIAYVQKMQRFKCQKQLIKSVKDELAGLLGFQSAAIYIKDGDSMFNISTEEPLQHTV